MYYPVNPLWQTTKNRFDGYTLFIPNTILIICELLECEYQNRSVCHSYNDWLQAVQSISIFWVICYFFAHKNLTGKRFLGFTDLFIFYHLKLLYFFFNFKALLDFVKPQGFPTNNTNKTIFYHILTFL